MKRLLLIPALLLSALSVMGQAVAYKVNHAGTALYETSTAPFNKLATLKRGETVLLVERVGGVLKVAYNGKTGFVNADNVVAADKYMEDPENAWHSVLTKRDTQVMGTSTVPIKEAYKAIHQALIENNYNIEKADEDNFYLTATAPWGNGGISNGQYRLNIFLKAEDSTRVYLQGTYNASVNGALLGPDMDFSGELQFFVKNSIPGRIFDKMTKIAASVPGSKVQYRKKPKQ